MKQLKINSVQFKLSLEAFKQWLQTLGYSQSAVKNYPIHVQELLHYIEAKNITKAEQITEQHITGFVEKLKIRPNQTYGGGLSGVFINHIIDAVNKYLEYLRLAKDIHIQVELIRVEELTQQRDILTVEEVQKLFSAIDNTPNPVIAKRDKAILTVLYAAGLRKNELTCLDVQDVSLTNKTIHVKHGKGNKQRIVPVTEKMFKYIQSYITECRDIFCELSDKSEEALFIDINGKRLQEDVYYNIIKLLIKEANQESINKKRVSLHTFRHSIATHLLQAGMDIEYIAQFLGHASLDSTMIYTHLAEELKHQEI